MKKAKALKRSSATVSKDFVPPKPVVIKEEKKPEVTLVASKTVTAVPLTPETALSAAYVEMDKHRVAREELARRISVLESQLNALMYERDDEEVDEEDAGMEED